MPFATTEMQRLRDCLARLLPHLDRAQVALTGGVAIELILAERGLPGNRDTIADLDLIAGSRTAIAASIADSFLVCHYHLPQPGYPKFLVMVVDPVSRLRIDIFPDLAGSLARARRG